LKFLSFISTVSLNASCLANVPPTFKSYFVSENTRSTTDSSVLLGTLYSLDEQCRLIYGGFSRYCNGVRI
jgi:hypothetical protein